MGNDVTANWLLWIDCVAHGCTGISHDLVAHEDSNVELLTDFLNSVQELAEHLLSFGQLTSSREVNSERGHDGVNHKEGIGILYHCSSCFHEQSSERVHCEGTPNHDVAEHLLWIKLKSFGDLLDTLWSEGVLCVDVENLALSSTLTSWQLCSDA